MSGITNLIITFYNGTRESADVIRDRLKQHSGDYVVKIISNRGTEKSHLDSIVEFYDDTEIISVDEWDVDDVNRVIEPLMFDKLYLDGNRIIEMAEANQVEVTVACRMSYMYGAKVYCGKMKGENKMISAPRMVDISKLSRMKKAILKAVEDCFDHTVDDIHRIIKERELENFKELTQKHVRTHVVDLVERGLLEANGRTKTESGRSRTKYCITEKGRVSMTLHRQEERLNR